MGATNSRNRKRRIRFATVTVLVALGLTLVAGLAPVGVAAQAATEIPVFHNQLEESTAAGKLTITDEPLASLLAPHARTATVIQPVAAPKATTTAAKTTSTSTEPATAEAPRDETSEAQSILAGYISKYPILAGTTITFGDAQGYQAIAYYKSGRIVISADHTASLSRIIGHEIWHIIDYRDNGVIDWGENIPPN